MRIIKGATPTETPWVVAPPIPQAAPTPAADEPQGDPLAKAQEQAAAMLERAKAEAEQIRQAAQQEGYQQGYQEGQVAAEKELEEVWQELFQNICNEVQTLQQELDGLIAGSEEEVVRLSLAIATKILKTESRLGPDYVAPIAQAALAKLVGRMRVTLYLNPADCERIQDHCLLLPQAENLKTLPDPKVGFGGCRIETECGRADATLYHQIQTIAKGMLEDLGFAGPAIESLHEPHTLPPAPQNS